ncbi:PKD domain-containing protein [Gynurincola endophyticus]|uniref:PKD domain-containing protein n=1 Tax=Gynurincola endophyticus TaxID=2479004 RepID=UPI000F8C3E01|nr:PKD domain-containing protein [Gynurincola endophyticus]
MKKITSIILTIIVLVIFGCEKEKESGANCTGESRLVGVSHTASPNDSKQINFVVSYSGSQSVDNSVKWDFGDGTDIQTVNSLSTNHIYSGSGTFNVKATITLNDGECSYSIDEAVTVQ